MVPKVGFDKGHKMKTSGRQDWERDESGLVLFTDSSKTEDEMEASFF